jgi:hypothetical protein
VPPTLTVKVAGAKAKLSILTWSPATGADAVPVGAPPVDGIPVMPGIPGVLPPGDPKVTDGCESCRGAEHPASNSTPTANTPFAKTTRCVRNMAKDMATLQGCGTVAKR